MAQLTQGDPPVVGRGDDPEELAASASESATAVLAAGPDGPRGPIEPVARLLASLPGVPFVDGAGTLVVAIAGSDDDVHDVVVPWSPVAGGRSDRMVLAVLGPDEVAVVGPDGVRTAPSAAGAFEDLPAVRASVAAGASVSRFTLGSSRAFAVRASVRARAAAMLVGVARASLADATVYGRERIVFGRPVLAHQANAFDLAAAATAVEVAAQGLVSAAATADDTEYGWIASHAYLQARDAAVAATDLGLQLHGGQGYLNGRLTERLFREARTLSLLWGGRDAAIEDLSARVLDEPAWRWWA